MARYRRILASLRDGGWHGRPILVQRLRDRFFRYGAWTGSHRVAAAQVLDLKIPVLLCAQTHSPPNNTARIMCLLEAGELEATRLMQDEVAAREWLPSGPPLLIEDETTCTILARTCSHREYEFWDTEKGFSVRLSLSTRRRALITPFATPRTLALAAMFLRERGITSVISQEEQVRVELDRAGWGYPALRKGREVFEFSPPLA